MVLPQKNISLKHTTCQRTVARNSRPLSRPRVGVQPHLAQAWDGADEEIFLNSRMRPPGRHAFPTAEIIKHNLFLKKKKRCRSHRRIFIFQEQMAGQQKATISLHQHPFLPCPPLGSDPFFFSRTDGQQNAKTSEQFSEVVHFTWTLTH